MLIIFFFFFSLNPGILISSVSFTLGNPLHLCGFYCLDLGKWFFFKIPPPPAKNQVFIPATFWILNFNFKWMYIIYFLYLNTLYRHKWFVCSLQTFRYVHLWLDKFIYNLNNMHSNTQPDIKKEGGEIKFIHTILLAWYERDKHMLFWSRLYSIYIYIVSNPTKYKIKSHE